MSDKNTNKCNVCNKNKLNNDFKKNLCQKKSLL